MVEVVDLLIATAMLFDLVTVKEEEGPPSKTRPSGNLDREKATQIIILGNKKCWLTFESTTLPLIKAMAHVASISDLKLDRAKRRRLTKTEDGALGPAMRIRYDLMRHVPPSELFEHIRGTRTPLQDLSHTMAGWPCVFDSPQGMGHTRLGPALSQLKYADPRSADLPRRKIVDSFDVIRMQGQPA